MIQSRRLIPIISIFGSSTLSETPSKPSEPLLHSFIKELNKKMMMELLMQDLVYLVETLKKFDQSKVQEYSNK